ncbi:MAG: tyrosine-type recombinase/integrase [Gammaproteobacteria bacterium]|nr:tyrosine-type recombinase/integrase [Gammaproteobacteria bacterium]MDE0414533.1 tyrosine-type recombinase/integrase [Gammaproteobacteria bacterium]
MPRVDLTAHLARKSKAIGKDTFLFDKSLPGFGLRIHPSGRKVWIVQARIEGRSRRMVIARYGDMKLAEARRRARDMLDRIRAGENPAEDIRREKRMPTVREFSGEYLRRCDPYWKPSGRRTVRIYLKARILPAFGKMPVDRVGPEDVAAWFDEASRDYPGAANRAFEILRSMMFRAEECGLRERGTNPCIGIRKNPRRNIARCLGTDELARLGRSLDAHEDRWPEAVAAIRLLALTGCRRGEVLNLRWRDIGARAITLPDSKTGPRSVPLGESARTIVNALPGPRRKDAFLFPKNAGRRSPFNIAACWRTVCEDAKLGKVRLHDLRHTAASHAVMSGENLPLVGKLLGHRRRQTTAGYAHLTDEHLVEAAEKVGSLIASAMNRQVLPAPSRRRRAKVRLLPHR